MGSMERVAAQLGAAAGTEFHRSSELDIGGSGWPRVLEVVQHFGGDTYVTGHGARRYLDGEAFEAAGVEVRYMDYACTPYPQQHGDFTPYVSVLDLVANVGEDAASATSRPARSTGARSTPRLMQPAELLRVRGGGLDRALPSAHRTPGRPRPR